MKRLFVLMAALLMTSTLMTSCFKDRPDTSKQGLYIGVIGFNDDIHSMKLTLLNNDSKESMKSFIDDLTMENGTVLYHAVNTALDKIEDLTPPEDLINVSIITFTDGLDQGSYKLNPNYNSGEEYLNGVCSRIRNSYVGEERVPISAYSIGVKGADVNNDALFRQSLEKLSSDPRHNVYLVGSMNQVGQIFSDIAQDLYHQSSTWDVTLKTPAPEPGTRIRFTFDNVANAEESQKYIEGVFSNENGTDIFSSIVYEGLRNCGSIIYPASEGIFSVFTFTDLLTLEGDQVYTTNTKQWQWDNAIQTWTNNSEFTPSGNTVVQEEYKSALVMLVLDCSSSLGNDFQSVKSTACQFIETLNGNTHQQRF
ncbi:MAG: VWA domain-containing protein [Bacteroidales bacterium]|nr:VWA domain-containing protein [Bacteroidales bacterium]